jgi:methanogenic corrinoid protein MtbC1
MHGALPPLDVFLEALISGDSKACIAMTSSAVAQPADLQDLYLHLFQPALYAVGDLWATHRISVAQEHLATAIIQRLMAQFYPLLATVPRNGNSAVLTTVPHEYHEVGARMVADFLELSGWTVIYTGANTPLRDLRDLVEANRPQVIGISAGMLSSLTQVSETISAVRTLGDYQPVVIVGGQAFQHGAELWRRVGADAYSPTADRVLNALAHRLSLVEAPL